jgi:hypothetical protein
MTKVSEVLYPIAGSVRDRTTAIPLVRKAILSVAFGSTANERNRTT